MTPEQRYFFDLTGYLHLEQVLQGDELARAQEAAERYLDTPPESCRTGTGSWRRSTITPSASTRPSTPSPCTRRPGRSSAS